MGAGKSKNQSQYGTQGGSANSVEGSGRSLNSTQAMYKPGPKLRDFILFPWICAVCLVLITILSFGASIFWAVVPAAVVIFFSVALLFDHNKKGETAQAIFYGLCTTAGFSGFIVSLIAYVHFLQPYNQLGSGATYLDMLPSQSALGAADATALVFAQGTWVDQARTFGYVDAREPDANTYCVAPLANKWTAAERGVQFFAAGLNCCGKRKDFGCGQGGSGARGALILASEESADPGFRLAVEGAAVAYNLMPANGYLLLNMMPDPMQYRQDKLGSALKLLLIYALVYLMISCVFGYFAFNSAGQKSRHARDQNAVQNASTPVNAGQRGGSYQQDLFVTSVY